MTDPAQTPAVLYGAKSTQDRKKSIPTQLADCRAFAEEKGWDVVGAFSDEGFSAYSGNRGPNLERAKRAAAEAAEQSGTPCMLVAQHSDRFARGSGDEPGAADSGSEIWHAMRRKNVHLRFVQNDEASKDGVYMALAAKMSHEESKRKSAATRAGKKRRAERGDAAGPLSFGYRLVPKADGEGKVRVPDPDEAPVVVRMFEMLDEGQRLGEITRWLNRQGVRTKRGNAFSRTRVRDILGNPWYGGKVRGYGEVRDGNHEPLMPWAEFERISSKLNRRDDPVSVTKRSGGRPSEVALLSGVMFCAQCGHGIWHSKGSNRRYVCGHVRHATGACDAAPFDAKRVEEAVLEHLSSLFLDFDGWLTGVTAHRDSQRDGLVRELAALQSQGADLERDEALVRTSYMKELRKGNGRAAELATGELERIESDRSRIDVAVRDLEARLAEWDDRSASDEMLDWWTEFSSAIRGGVVNATSIREANTALRERFAAIYVRSPRGGSPRLDFILKEREPGAPLVSSRLWADDPDDLPDDGLLVDFVQESAPSDRSLARPSETDLLTFVNVHPVSRQISRYE